MVVSPVEGGAEDAVAEVPTMEISRQQQHQTPVPEIINLIRKEPNILTYLPVLIGRVLSTGRKDAKLLIVAIPLSANGCP